MQLSKEFDPIVMLPFDCVYFADKHQMPFYVWSRLYIFEICLESMGLCNQPLPSLIFVHLSRCNYQRTRHYHSYQHNFQTLLHLRVEPLHDSPIFRRLFYRMCNMDCKVASSNTSHLEAHAGYFRLLMKGIFDLMYCDLLKNFDFLISNTH